MIDLLPCPFCGTKRKAPVKWSHATPWIVEGEDWTWVTCDKCDASGPRWPSRIEGAGRYAAEQWNTRCQAPPARPRSKTAKAMQREANAAIAPKKKRAPAKRKVVAVEAPAVVAAPVGSNGEDSAASAQMRLPDRLAAITDHR